MEGSYKVLYRRHVCTQRETTQVLSRFFPKTWSKYLLAAGGHTTLSRAICGSNIFSNSNNDNNNDNKSVDDSNDDKKQ